VRPGAGAAWQGRATARDLAGAGDHAAADRFGLLGGDRLRLDLCGRGLGLHLGGGRPPARRRARRQPARPGCGNRLGDGLGDAGAAATGSVAGSAGSGFRWGRLDCGRLDGNGLGRDGQQVRQVSAPPRPPVPARARRRPSPTPRRGSARIRRPAWRPPSWPRSSWPASARASALRAARRASGHHGPRGGAPCRRTPRSATTNGSSRGCRAHRTSRRPRHWSCRAPWQVRVLGCSSPRCVSTFHIHHLAGTPSGLPQSRISFVTSCREVPGGAVPARSPALGYRSSMPVRTRCDASPRRGTHVRTTTHRVRRRADRRARVRPRR
jgi:hypothetical protein